jgi:hypothetical protein
VREDDVYGRRVASVVERVQPRELRREKQSRTSSLKQRFREKLRKKKEIEREGAE